jgi:hypothetical protein
MRRLVTSFVVVGVAVLAVLAAADALRSGGDETVAESVTTIHPRGRPTVAGTLRRDAISGQLFYSDVLCRLRTIELPSLHRDEVLGENGSELARCEFSLGAGHLLPGGTAVSQDESTIARCHGGRVVVRDVLTDAVLARAKGCPAAWRPLPDGRSQLTHVQGGQIVADDRVLVSRADLLRAARRNPNILDIAGEIRLHVLVSEFAWLDQHRVAAIFRIRARYLESQQMLALLDRGRVIGMDVRFDGPIRGLVASPHSNYVAVEPGTVMDASGSSWQLPRTLDVMRIFGFSPDERWLAVGTRASLYLVSVVDLQRSEPQPRIDRVPILATDLVWEPGGAVMNTLRPG